MAKNKKLSWHDRCAKLGIAVRFSFLREIKAATGCGDAEAETVFAEAVILGQIVKVKEWGGGRRFMK